MNREMEVLMKKQYKSVIIGLVSVVMSIPTIASSAISISYNDSNLILTHPVILNNERVMIPLRDLCEQFGYYVEWNQQLQRIQLSNGETNTTLYLNNKQAVINNAQIQMDVEPVLVNSTTYVPLRFISESFGYNVNWNESNKTVIIKETMNVYNGNYTVDKRNKKLLYKKNGVVTELGDVLLTKNGTICLDIKELENGGNIIIITNNYGQPALFVERTLFYTKDDKTIKSDSYQCNIPRTQSFTCMDNLVGICDGKKVYIYNNITDTLIKECDLTQIIGDGIYTLEVIGNDFLLVREDTYDGGGLLTLIDLTNNRIQILYELIPNVEDRDYARYGALPTNDGITFKNKMNNVLTFSYYTFTHTIQTLTYTLGSSLN